MFSLTKHEQTAVWFLLGVIVAANLIRLTVDHSPLARRALDIVERERLYPRVDINRASIEELDAIPYIGQKLAWRITNYRREHGPFRDISELRHVPGMRETFYQKIEGYVRVK